MKETIDFRNINLLGTAEQGVRLERVRSIMRTAGIDAALVRSNVVLYYLTGRVFRGYIYLDLRNIAYFVRQPLTLLASEGEQMHFIRKPEDIAPLLAAQGIEMQGNTALELDTLPYSEVMRLTAALGMSTTAGNMSAVLRNARMVKTAEEQRKLEISGEKHAAAYSSIHSLYRPGMTDIEIQVEIERVLRLEGCLGIFRTSGTEMETHMGSLVTGDNSDTPSPYDFAMGGAGADPSLPIGANGTLIEPGIPVMVDLNGNFNGYMTDMSRCFYTGELSSEAMRANEVSISICHELAAMMRPGVKTCDLYNRALQMATDAGLANYFMGHTSHAGFVGHGVGIEINEAPVLAPRSKDIIEEGMVLAVEPKFVIPGIGAIGVENTYIVGADAGRCITNAPLEPVQFN